MSRKIYVVTASTCKEYGEAVDPYDTYVEGVFMNKKKAIKFIVDGAREYFGSEFDESKCIEGINEGAYIPYSGDDCVTCGYQLVTTRIYG